MLDCLQLVITTKVSFNLSHRNAGIAVLLPQTVDIFTGLKCVKQALVSWIVAHFMGIDGSCHIA